jgi:glycosyltransferase involved in cell wall biosynthesis
VVSRAVVNFEAAKAMSRLIDDTRPDLIHLQNIHHQLTPAIVFAAAKKQVPIVWTMHDYILACPNDNLLRDGRICVECLSGKNYPIVLHRCKKGSRGASILAALERMIFNPRRLSDLVSKFICPSKFMAGVLQQTGIPSKKMTVLPNFLIPDNTITTGDDYFLYAGRLTMEKGVETLIDAFGKIKHCKLVIAGEGPHGDYLKAKVAKSGCTNIDFIGYRPPADINKLLSGCIASVVPSICYENFPTR